MKKIKRDISFFIALISILTAGSIIKINKDKSSHDEKEISTPMPTNATDDIIMEYDFEADKLFEYENVNDFAYIVNNTVLYDSDKDNKEIVTNIDQYQKVLRLQVGNNFTLVQTQDLHIGYIDNNSLSVLPDLFIEIDISDQIINMYKDHNIILTSLIVSGKDSTPTRIGYFPIAYKVYDTYLKGVDYNCHVNYWMPFDGGIGLHDASWRSEFGGTIYNENGSHGCVNLPNEAAKSIYETAQTGDYVLVHR